MPIDNAPQRTPEGFIKHRLRSHGFNNAHATLMARALMFAVASPEFATVVGTFGVELLAEAIAECDME